MSPIKFAMRRPVTTLLLVGILVAGCVVGLNQMKARGNRGVNYALSGISIDSIGASLNQAKEYVTRQFASHSESKEEDAQAGGEESHQEGHEIVVTSPKVKDVVIAQPYVCQIRAQRHIEVCALSGGYLQEILVKEGQAVKKGDLMFKILPVLYKARYDAEAAEAHLAELRYNNTKALCDRKVVAPTEVALVHAEYTKAQAKASLADAELKFTDIVAPFDGIVDRLMEREGSLIDEGDTLTTLSDNSVMWVYFNVPEARYLDYMSHENLLKSDQIELVLANGKTFKHTGRIGAIEAKFNNETGNIPFRADFPNPDKLLRHGQTGTVVLHRTSSNAIVIPQRATFELLDKRYVYVIGDDDVAHQRLVTIQNELDDVFIVGKGLEANDKFVVEGVRDVHDGQKVKFELRHPDEVFANQKKHAE